MSEAATNEQSPAPEMQPDAKPKKVKQTAEEKAAIKAEKDRVKAEAKAKKDAEKAEPKAPRAKDTKNGVTRPSTGVTLLVWTTADRLSGEAKAPTERAPLVEALKGQVEVGTIHTQYGRWRKYYGLVETKEQRQARLDKAKAAKVEKTAAAKLAKQAEKDEKARLKAEEKAKKDAVKAEADKAKVDEAAKQAAQAPQQAAA